MKITCAHALSWEDVSTRNVSTKKKDKTRESKETEERGEATVQDKDDLT